MRPFGTAPLSSARLTLRPLTADDVGPLFAIHSDPRAMRYWSGPIWKDDERGRLMVMRDLDPALGDYLRLGIELTGSGSLLGTCTFFQINDQCRRAELGYMLAPQAWGQGYMREALFAFLDFGFDHLGLNRVEADTDPRNERSMKLLERLRFTKEGHFRERWIVDGEVSDAAMYGLLHRDWRREASPLARERPAAASRSVRTSGGATQSHRMLRILEVDPQGVDALALLREAAIEARALYPELFSVDSPWPTNSPTPAGGVYLVAYREAEPVACGALIPLEGSVAEVRRMFVSRGVRRGGIASAVLVELEARARALGYCALRLETGHKQAPAMALYEAHGFKRIEPFGRYIDDPTSVCFEKVLDVSAAGAA